MAQTGFTPIQLYSSSTTGNTPAVGDLLNSTGGSELAINIFDGKLFYKDSSNAIQVIGWKVVPVSAGGTGVTSASITAFNNITGYTATGATGTTSTNLVFSTSPTLVTPTIGVATATSINKMAITAPATSSTLAIADGKTFTVNRTLTLTGTDTTTMTFPTTSATIARTDAAQTFTGTQTFGDVIASTVQANFNYADTGVASYGAGTSFTLTVSDTTEGAMYLISVSRNTTSTAATNRVSLLSYRSSGSFLNDIIANANVTISVSGATITVTGVGTASLYGSVLGLRS
jgi:hypothetical protein